MAEQTEGSGFTGWHRRGPGTWQAVCEAATEAGAWQLLLDKAAGGHKCVLPGGSHPDEGRRARRF
jgi:hypothetical protein